MYNVTNLDFPPAKDHRVYNFGVSEPIPRRCASRFSGWVQKIVWESFFALEQELLGWRQPR